MDYIINTFIKNDLILEEDRDIYEYSLSVIVFNIFSVAVSVLLGILVNQSFFILIFFLSFIPFRIFIGGYHCKTPARCFIAFQIIILLILCFNQKIDVQMLKLMMGLFLFVLVHNIFVLKNITKYHFISIMLYSLFLYLVIIKDIFIRPISCSLILNFTLYYANYILKKIP